MRLWSEPFLSTLRDRAGDVDMVGIERPSDDPAIQP